MRQDANISVTGARQGTNAPFTQDSTLTIQSTRLSPKLFVSIRVFCNEAVVPPVRISHIQKTVDTYELFMSDAANRKIGSFIADRQDNAIGNVWSTLITAADGTVKGHVTYDGNQYSTLWSTLQQINGMIRLADSAFVLLPFCLVAEMSGGLRTIHIDGETTTEPVCIVPAACVHVGVSPSGVISVDAGRPEKLQTEYGFRWLGMDNVDHIDGSAAAGTTRMSSENMLDITGCHLVFRSGLTSNLRVITDVPEVRLEGVLDG